MNKYAAEKIASEYYNLGVHLALSKPDLVKEAYYFTNKDVIKKLIQMPAAGLGGLATGGAIMKLPQELTAMARNEADRLPFGYIPRLLDGQEIDHLGQLLTTPQGIIGSLGLAGLGAGGMAGAHLAGKGVDLVHRGGSKAIDLAQQGGSKAVDLVKKLKGPKEEKSFISKLLGTSS